MAGYLGAKPVVAQVDGFTKTQSDARYVSSVSSMQTIDGDIINISSDISGGYTGMFNYPFINLKRDVSSTKLGQIDFYGLNSNSDSRVYNSVFANNSLIGVNAPMYVAGFDRGVLPIGD